MTQAIKHEYDAWAKRRRDSQPSQEQVTKARRKWGHRQMTVHSIRISITVLSEQIGQLQGPLLARAPRHLHVEIRLVARR